MQKYRKNKSCTATIDCDKVREPFDAKKKVLGYGTEISSSEYTIIQVVPKKIYGHKIMQSGDKNGISSSSKKQESSFRRQKSYV